MPDGTDDVDPDDLRLATEFWSEVHTTSLTGALLAGRIIDSAGNHLDFDYDQFLQDINATISNMGYGLGYVALMSLKDAVRQSQLAYWRGVYTLKSAAVYYQLVVEDDTASCWVGGQNLQFDSFAATTLHLKGDDGTTLDVLFRENDPDESRPDQSVGLSYCDATLTLPGAQPLKLSGKIGCCFPASVDWDKRGDPLSAWAGDYTLVDMDSAEDFDRLLTIGADGSAKLGDTQLTPSMWSDNKLIATDANQIHYEASFATSITYVAVQDSSGWRQFAAKRNCAPAAAAAMMAPKVRLAAFTGPSAAAGPAGYPDDPLPFDIPKGATTLALPEAVEKNPYAIQFTYDGGSPSDWTVADILPYPDQLVISPAGALVGVFGETQHAAHYTFKLKFTDSQQAAHIIACTMPVSSRRNITLSPEELKPFIKGKTGSQRISADGFVEGVYWRADPPLDKAATGLSVNPLDGETVPVIAKYVTVEGSPTGDVLSTVSLTLNVWPDPGTPADPGTIQTPTNKSYSIDVADDIAFNRTEGIASIIGIVMAIADLGLVIWALVKSHSKPSEVEELTKKIDAYLDGGINMQDLDKTAKQAKADLAQVQTDLKTAIAAKDALNTAQTALQAKLDAAEKKVTDAKTEFEKRKAEIIAEAAKKAVDDLKKALEEANRKKDEKTDKGKESERAAKDGGKKE